jgi:type II secretory pathway component PulJ
VSGLTLVEVLLAVSTLAVVALLAAGALRVGLRAWEAGQRYADAHQETRALVEVLTETLQGAYPYRARRGGSPERRVLFEGEPGEVRFVTTAAPLALDVPAAPFHAVVLGRSGSGRLRMLERLVPAESPFEDGAEAVLSPTVADVRLAYRDESGAWQERWDGGAAAGLPTAVRLELTLGAGDRTRALPPIIVPIALGKRTP